MTEKSVVVVPEATLAQSTASRLLGKIALGLNEDRDVHLALSGGRAVIAVLAAVADNSMTAMLDWSRVHVWWNDERFVPRGSDERNADLTRRALLGAVPIPAANVHEIAASDDGLTLDEATEAYAAELARFGEDGNPWPRFDLSLLGVGADGHVASLFPDRGEVLVTDRVTVAVRNAPKLPAERVSLTRPVLNSAQRVWLVLVGEEKAGALGLALAGASYASVPAAGAKGVRKTVFVVDEAAALQAPPELIEPDF